MTSNTDFDTIIGVLERFFALVDGTERPYVVFMHPEIVQMLVQSGAAHQNLEAAPGFDLQVSGVLIQGVGQLGLVDLVTVPVSKCEEFHRLQVEDEWQAFKAAQLLQT